MPPVTIEPVGEATAPSQVEANHLTENAGIRQKLETKINAKNAIKADESAKGALDKLIEAYEKTVAGSAQIKI